MAQAITAVPGDEQQVRPCPHLPLHMLNVAQRVSGRKNRKALPSRAARYECTNTGDGHVTKEAREH